MYILAALDVYRVKSPGMAVIASHHHHGHEEAHADHHRAMMEDYKRRFLVSLALTVPILLLSPEVKSLLGLEYSLPGEEYVLWALSTAVYAYGGKPFLAGMVDELRKRLPGMKTLVSVAITAAYLYSSSVVFLIPGRFFFWELATLIDVMLLGHWIEMRSVLGASRALEMLVEALPRTARLVRDGEVVEVHVSELKPGDRVLVRPGDKVPVDGVVVEGSTSVDESLITGESRPVYKAPGSTVIAGTINLDGSVIVEVRSAGKDTYLSQVIELVKSIQASKSRAQDLANRAAKWLTLVALAGGGATFAFWRLVMGFDTVFALERMITVMVIACPHALGLSTPLVIARSTAISASKGILIRNRIAFENARLIDTVVFDKTGTLTKGRLSVSRVVAMEGSPEEVLSLAAALEERSEHPIARAIVAYARERGVSIPRAEEFKAIPGVGVEGVVDGSRVRLVSLTRALEEGLIPRDSPLAGEPATVVVLVVDSRPIGAILLSDSVRPESREAVETLKSMGIRSVMLTGDNRAVAESVARQLGIDEVIAEVLPHEKADAVRRLKSGGRRVAMVGDGVNDAPALMEADVGIAIGAGTDIAVESADIVLVKNDPRDVATLIELSRRTYSKMKQNLAWATGYNVAAIPAAAGALYWAGFLLPPAAAALLMSLSTVIVAINASRV